MYLLRGQRKLKTKLTLLVVVAVMISVTVLGVYFDGFIQHSFVTDAEERVLHGYARLLTNIDDIENSLREGVVFINNDKEMIASLELINNYQDKENYNTFLIDEEKKAIGKKLLDLVKISFNESISLYDGNRELVAFVAKHPNGYKVGYVSYKTGNAVVYLRRELEQEFFPGTLPDNPDINLEHQQVVIDEVGGSRSPISYRRFGETIVIASQRHISDGTGTDVVGYASMSSVLDRSYFAQLSEMLGVNLRYSFEAKSIGAVPLLRSAVSKHDIQLTQVGNYFRTVVMQHGQNGPIYYTANLDKSVLNALLAESRIKLVFILVLVAITTLLLMQYVIRLVIDIPLSKLMKQIHKIEAHDYSVSEAVATGDELETISGNINQLAVTVQERESSLERSMTELEFLSGHDALTGLPNRRLFTQRLQHALELSARSNARLSVIFLDLDQFKLVNDTLGHNVGDELLLQVAGRLKASMRKSDTLARIGGDEFNILIENVKGSIEIEHLAGKYLALFKEPFNCFGHTLTISASIGLALYPEDGTDAISLTKHADLAMYSSKDRGRNSYTFFSKELSVYANERVMLIQALENAIVSDEQFEVYYQAKVDAKSHKICSVEALLRWNHPKRGMMPPESFIQLAEETSLILAIGDWVLERACRDFVEMQSRGIELRHVSVNVSNVQMNSADMIQRVQEVIRRTGIHNEQLELEITESYIATNLNAAIETLKQLSEMGVGIAIDDFGTGYSSMSYLQRLPVTRLKIDKSFVSGLPDSEDSKAIIRAIIGLAKSFGLSITAEGVEKAGQAAFLERESCDEIQGYYFSKPLPLHRFIEKYYELNDNAANKIIHLSSFMQED